jgi:hypothetical protein
MPGSPKQKSAGALGCGRRSCRGGELRAALDPIELARFAAVYGKPLALFLG